MRIDDDLIDRTLRDGEAWRPPAHFAERTAARGVELLRGAEVPAPRLWSWINVASVIPMAVLTALAVYFGRELLLAVTPSIVAASATSVPTAWLWVAGSCAVAAWFGWKTDAAH
jgi:hypothetical protein